MHARRMAKGVNGLPPMMTLPGVQSLALAARYLDGGRQRFVEFIQLAMLNGLEPAQKWWAAYCDLMPSERTVVSFDDVCAASGVRPSSLMAAVVTTAMEQSLDVGNLIAAASHPAVVAKAVESAQRIAGKGALIGLKDREMLFQHSNFVPLPKGASIHVHANASANAQAAAQVDQDPSVPSFAADMHALRPVTRQLGPVDPALQTIDTSAITDPVSVSAAK